MKQYLYTLKSGDFTKVDNVWRSSSINLYNNDQYKNFSYSRFSTGLDLIGTRIFSGTEIASPNTNGDHATPVDSNAVYVTDLGEVIYDSATPDLLRFVDTFSEVDILSYKYKFTNLQGITDPSFNISIYESDSADGPWLRNIASGQIGTLFITDVKPYIQVELSIDSDEADLNSVGLVFYLEIGIHDPVSPVATRSVKNVLKRFPSWTSLYSDSENSATPQLDIPDSEGGKFLTALVQDSFELFQKNVDLHQINSFINSADEDMLAWMYVSYNVPPNISSVKGDAVSLASVSSFNDFLSLRKEDYAYYYDPLGKKLYSIRSFDNLTVNGISFDQEAINIFNDFDEFGARMGLPRLYLESNALFKKRILDAAANPGGSNLEGLKLILRRELDIWRAYGATPDSNYLGATPEILEISDIETSTPYVSYSGKPESAFKDFVTSLNERYPSNYGYVKWDDGVWDYGGILGEGVSRVPAVYDEDASPLGVNYQPGVGDFDDAKLYIDIDDNSNATVSFDGYVEITGLKEVDYSDAYMPIVVDYSWYASYLINIADVNAQRDAVESFASNQIDLTSDDIDALDQFGYKTAMSRDGNTLVVSSYKANIELPGFFGTIDTEGVGAVYVFNRSGSSWTQVAKLDQTEVSGGNGAAEDDLFGYSIAISGDGLTIVVGSPNNSSSALLGGSGPLNGGAAFVYRYTGGVWTYEDYLVPDIPQANCLFGFSVDVSYDGNVVVVGSPSWEYNSIVGGAFHSFFYGGSSWSYEAAKIPTGTLDGDDVGWSISLADDVSKVFISAPNFNYGSGLDTGAVYIYDMDFTYYPSLGVKWINEEQLVSDLISDRDYFGISIDSSHDGKYLVVGANEDNLATPGTGYISVFAYSSEDGSTFAWQEMLKYSSDDSSLSDGFGSYVSISNDKRVISVGTSLNDGDVYIYSYDKNETVKEIGRLSPVSSETTTSFGNSFSFSNYADSFVVGSPGDDEYASPNGGSVDIYDSILQTTGIGAAFVYEIDVQAHDNYATPSTFYANLNYESDESLLLENLYPENSSASPEYKGYKIFGSDSVTEDTITFRDKIYNEPYSNTLSTPNSTRVSIFDADEVRVIPAKAWNPITHQYDDVKVNDYKLSFDESTPNYRDGDGSSISIASPNIDSYNANLLIVSDRYDSTPTIRYTDTLSDSLILNSDNTFSSTSATPSAISVQSLKDYLIYPASATPENIYFNVSENVIYTKNNGELDIYTYGGVAKDPNDDDIYFVPSSPNIVFTQYDSSDSVVVAQDYFEAATIDYDGSVDYMSVESASGNFYPLRYLYYDFFSATTNDPFFSGFMDRYGNAYRDGEQLTNVFFNKDNLIDNYLLDASDFGITNNVEYIVENIKLISDSSDVRVFVDNPTQAAADMTAAIEQGEHATVSFMAAKEEPYKLAVNPGWIYYGEKDRYIYSVPHTQNENGQFFSITLDKTPIVGYPVIVSVDGEEYRNIVFEDSATPGNHSFYNIESVIGNDSNSLYLAYENVSDVTVTDGYNNSVLFTGLSSQSSIISPFDSSTPSVKGREYLVSYKVENSFFADPDVYNESSGLYDSILYLSSTPSSSSSYEITYETSEKESLSSVDLEVDQIDNPLNEGFVFVSDEDYQFNYVDPILSPAYIVDDPNDYMSLSLVSYDENNNLKPGQTFKVYGSNISAVPEYVTTNDNGFGFTTIRYSGAVPATLAEDSITIEGIGSATPNGGANSSSEGYFEDVNFKIVRGNNFRLKIKAIPVRFTLDADGQSQVVIAGRVYWDDKPLEEQIDLNWYESSSYKVLFTTSSPSSVTTNSDGSFYINDSITVNDNLNPGLRFVRIELQDPAAVESLLVSNGEVLASSDITISGDVVYWHELYDNIHYTNELLPMSSVFTVDLDSETQMLTTPSFVYDHSNTDVIYYSDSTPNWIPSDWIPIRKYDQYQLGLLGSTPNRITDYSNLHPDYEDS